MVITIKKKSLLVLSSALILLSLLLSLYKFLEFDYMPELISFLMIFLLLIIFAFLFMRFKEYPVPISIVLLLIVGFIFRSYYSYIVYSTIVSPFPDSFGYLSNLDKLLSNGQLDFKSMEATVGTSHFFYYYVLYFTYKIFSNYFSLYLVNIFLFSLSMLLLYRIVSKDFGKKIAYFTTLLSLLSTNFLLFTGNVLKDSLVLFLTILIIHIYKVNKKKHILLIIFLSGCLILTRIYAGFAIVAALGVDVLLSRFTFKKKSTKIASVLALVAATFILFNFTFLSRYFTLGQEFVSGYSLSSILYILPETLFNMIFEPYPMGIFSGEITTYSILQIDSALAVLFSFSLVLFSYKWTKYKQLRTKMYLYLTPILVYTIPLGIAHGGGVRQRIGIYCFIILIFVIGILYKPKQREND